jgi:hypothetical protein
MARNVKDKKNSKLTLKNLDRILTFLQTKKDTDLNMGLFIFAGVDMYDVEIFTTIVPKSKCDKFYYRCSNKFLIDGLDEYTKEYSGSIIFANGDSYYIYSHSLCGFELIDKKCVELGTRHKRGGQSQHRFERNFDIIKDYYVSLIIEKISLLQTTNNWIFGSSIIIDKILKVCKNVYNGGFLEFDKNTIKNTKLWIEYIKTDYIKFNKNEKILNDVYTLLQTNADRLDFDISRKDEMEFYVSKEEIEHDNKFVYLTTNSKFYDKLFEFEYIGVKYINNDYTDYNDY